MNLSDIKHRGGAAKRAATERFRAIGGPAHTFGRIYRKGVWGGSVGDFYSGEGSQEKFAERYVEAIVEIAKTRNARSILDIGCGDFRIGAMLVNALPDLTYTGVDVVPDLVARNQAMAGSDRVTFICADASKGGLPVADLCLIRQVLQHMSNPQITGVISEFSKFRAVVVTEHEPAPQEFRGYNHQHTFGANTRVDRGSAVRLSEPPFGLSTTDIFTQAYSEAGETLVAVLHLPSPST